MAYRSGVFRSPFDSKYWVNICRTMSFVLPSIYGSIFCAKPDKDRKKNVMSYRKLKKNCELFRMPACVGTERYFPLGTLYNRN